MNDLLQAAYHLETDGDLLGAESTYRALTEQGFDDGALELSGFFRRHGQLEKAEQALLEGERRGDPRCAVNLGYMLSDRGDLEGAEAAFRRADDAGLAVGAYALGGLLYARGDADGALAANRRADERGDGGAAYNVGLLLLQRGQLAEAEAALRRADERGDADAAVLLGRRLRDRGLNAESEAAFRRADERGDAEGAFEIAAIHYDRGQFDESAAAFDRAAERGKDGALELADRVREEAAGVAQVHSAVASSPLIDRCHSAVASGGQLLREVARVRAELFALEERAAEERRQLEVKLAVLDAEIQPRTRDLQRFVDEERRNAPGRFSGTASAAPPLHTGQLVVRSANGTYRVAEQVPSELAELLARARTRIREGASKRLGGGRSFEDAERAVAQYRGLLEALVRARDEVSTELSQHDQRRTSEAASAATNRAESVRRRQESVAAHLVAVPLFMASWSDRRWSSAETDGEYALDAPVLAGWLSPEVDSALGPNSSFGVEISIPFFIDTVPHLRIRYPASDRSGAIGLVQSIAVRRLVSAAPGDLNFHVFDPVGLGQSVSELLQLADFDADLIGGKVWSSPGDLRSLLASMTSHIELVVQKYLRTDYDDIHAFNATAGDIAEPIRYLVLLDYPNGFDRETFGELVRIIENGPRCGVHVIMGEVTDGHGDAYNAPPNLPDSVRTITPGLPFGESFDRYRLTMRFVPDLNLGDSSHIARRVESIGRASGAREDSVLSLSRLLELYGTATRRGILPQRPSNATIVELDNSGTWWQESSVSGISAAIGQRGAREVSVLTFDSSDHAGALLVGRPGSGKSTLLHSYIIGAATHYSPDELELYLIDFKEGVEFKGYAAAGLPHARCVAIESDREFGLSVLQALSTEISHRGELLRSLGGQFAGLEALRRSTGERMPRILLVFDEFHVLFSRNDKIGLAAAELLEQVIRQGRGFGVHVLLGSQSLFGLDALGSHVPQLLPVRILLAASEADGRRFLGEGNGAGQYLTTRGEGIFNPAGGAAEANERFRGALLDEQDRLDLVGQLRQLADRVGFERRPVVFDNSVSPLLDVEQVEPFVEAMRTTGSSPLRIRFGVPMTIHGAAEIALRREAGANVLVVARAVESASAGFGSSAGTPSSQLLSAVASLACSNARVDVVDFTPIDDGIEALLDPFLAIERVRVARRRGFPDLIAQVRSEVELRIAEDDTSAPPRVLLLFGLHRARELSSDTLSLDGDEELQDALEAILRDGPEVGVHVWAWSETLSGVTRKLPTAAIREFGWRVASKMSEDDSLSLIGSDVAAGLRQHQVVATNDDLGYEKRATAYGLPSLDWLKALMAEAVQQGSSGSTNA